MKKNTLFKAIFSVLVAMVLALGAFFTIDFSNSQKVLAEEEQKVTKTLTSDIAFSPYTEKFDIFNGKGYTVNGQDVEQDYNESFFGELSSVEVYNLKFYNITFVVEESEGILAKSIQNSVIRGIEFNSCTIVINNQSTLPILDVGFVAGSVSSSTIDQISFKNCSITTSQDFSIVSNNNVGFVAGSLISGTSIKNCIITDSNFFLKYDNELSESINVGSLVGYMESGALTNNIIDFYDSDSVIFDSELKKTINFGGLVGKTNNNVIEIYNNILCLSENSLEFDNNSITCNFGCAIGNMNVSLDASKIDGVLTTLDSAIIGNVLSADYNSKYGKTNLISRTSLDANVFSSNLYGTYWKEVGDAMWDFEKVWLESTLTNLPTLQIFNNYAISFNSKDCVDSLNLQQVPSVAEGNVVDGVLLDGNGEQIDVMKYGESLIVKAKITSQNTFDKFFKITGLRIGKSTVYKIGDTNSHITLINEIDEAGNVVLDEQGYVAFNIQNFTARFAGEYSVQLQSNIFNLSIKVLELTDENENKVVPGKVKNLLASESFAEINNIQMEYGVKYTYDAVITNTDYSDNAYWYLVDTNSINFSLEEFEYRDEITQFEQAKRFSWTFNENCELFNDLNGAVTAYDITNTEANYVILVAFPQTVRQLEISFKDNDGEVIKEKIANISIDGDASRIVWDEERGLYTAKIAYDKKEHVIKIEMLEVDYEFISWYEGVNNILSVESEGTMTGVFKVASSDDMEADLAETLSLHCKVNSKNVSGGGLLWLWIILAGVGVILIVVIIIIIRRRRGGGGTSYKKQFYY